MNDALTRFPATRTAALERLSRFVPHAGRSYAARRNHDLGRDGHTAVSTLSPYLRTRLITETEVLKSILGHHSPAAAEKFVMEVFWRAYWKGWLELRPQVWTQYRRSLRQRLDDVQTQGGLRERWESACTGATGIDCFDAWAQELVETGYLHNHARMWFASIWIFTLKLPWELGADFFLRHLLDGDPASNTLSWRWVAGTQTPGKTYLARPDNIRTYTEGRFAVTQDLAREAPPLPAPPLPDRQPLKALAPADPGKRTGLILHGDDLSPGFVLDRLGEAAPVGVIFLDAANGLSPLTPAPHIAAFHTAAYHDVSARWGSKIGGPSARAGDKKALLSWARHHDLQQIVTPYAPVGPAAAILAELAADPTAPPLIQMRRNEDSGAWPLATAGFFGFRKHIPRLLEEWGLAPS